MEKYLVTGMSCAACSARVEKAVKAVPGVSSCSVSLLTNTMGVEGTAPAGAIIDAVVAAGYGASPLGARTTGPVSSPAAGTAAGEDILADHETPVLKRRLITSLILLIPLIYLASGTTMLDLPLPAFLEGNPAGFALAQMVLTLIVLFINRKFFVSGLRGFLHRAPNMDTLVALGAGASFAWSLILVFGMTRAISDNDAAAVNAFLSQLYFESAAMIVTLITVGKTLEARSKGKTTDALRGLMRLAPQTAILLKDGREEEVSVEQVRAGDVFVVRPGGSIPVDGVVLEGASAVNEASLTGESVPVDKMAGDPVSAATVNQSGWLRCQAVRVGEDTTLAQIIRMVSDAAATKAPIAKIADRVSGIFVPVVIVLALLTIIVWLALGADTGFALARGISILVISCPCALGLATPVAIMVGNGLAARNGILFKTAAALEQTGRTSIVALDKTGTITMGAPGVTDVLGVSCDAKTLLGLAAALESMSEHPLARAVVDRAKTESLSAQPHVTEFKALPGNGLEGKLDGVPLFGGSYAFVAGRVRVPEEIAARARELAEQGKTPLFFARDRELLGVIAVADVIKADSRRAVSELRAMGLRVVMLTGDNERTARAVGTQAGVDEVIAGVLPDGKERVIRELKEQGMVSMVGDGINDAPALTRADTGIALGAGTDIAIDAADVVLMRSSLRDAAAAVRLSRATLRNIHQNLFWAFIYNIIGIPLAAGCLASFGLTLSPMFGAAAMSLSSFCVVSNALRLNFFRLHGDAPAAGADSGNVADSASTPVPATDNSRASDAGVASDTRSMEETTMTTTIAIKGMMCGHCEKHMKDALEKIDGVISATCDHNAAQAVVETSREVSEDEYKAAVKQAGYEYQGIK